MSAAAQHRHSFFFLIPTFLHLGPLIRMILDVISAGQDGGYTLLTPPSVCPTHDTGLGDWVEGPVWDFRHTTPPVQEWCL